MRRNAPVRPWASASPPAVERDNPLSSSTPSPHGSPVSPPLTTLNGSLPPATSGKPFKPPTKRTNSGNGSNPVLNAIGLAQPSLKLHLQESVVFLHPAPKGQPSEDPFLTGSVTLFLPKARTLKKLTVRLWARQDIGWPDGQHPYESHIVLDKTVSLFQGGEEGLHLEKGEHTFAFSILVPSSTPTYERCPYGRVRHFVAARAKGLGAMHSDVTSEEKFVYLIANPGGPGASRPPPALDYRLEGHVNEVGLYAVALKSNHFLVGGLLVFRLRLFGAPTDLMIYTIKVKINQHYTLQSHVDPTRVVQPLVDRRTIILIDANHPANECKTEKPPQSTKGKPESRTPTTGPLKLLKAGEGFYTSHLGRVPNDNIIRPTTQEGTEAGIRVSHEIVVELTYKAILPSDNVASHPMTESLSTSSLAAKKKDKHKEQHPPGHDRERKKMTITKPIDIFSCVCFVDSLTLPVYSEEDPHPQPDPSAPPCCCDYSLDAMMNTQHGTNLLREETEDEYWNNVINQGTTAAMRTTNGHSVVTKTEDERASASAAATRRPSLQLEAALAASPPTNHNNQHHQATVRQTSLPGTNFEYGSTDETLMTVSERLGQL